MKIWGVYTQFYPTWKYEEALESLWSTKELALKAAQEHVEMMDYVWVCELNVDNGMMCTEDCEIESVKKF